MIFVPLPLFATLCLFFVLIRMVYARDMTARTNQLFAGLVGLYALQSLLLCMRWGYGFEEVAFWIGMLAPVLPVVAYLSYLALMDRLTILMLWPLVIVALNWVILILVPNLADLVILMTYLSFGAIILWNASNRGRELALVRISQTDGALRAMIITGIALICSAFMDLYVIADFIRTGGQNIGFSVTLIQTGFLLCIGFAAIMSQSGATENTEPEAELSPKDVTEEDEAIITRLTQLFETENLHADMELSLRRLSRRLGLPDRSVSQAINKTQNMGVSQFVNRYRIRDACKLLKNSDQSILHISLASGFMTKSNFNREFARVTGQTPTRWRQSSQKTASHFSPLLSR